MSIRTISCLKQTTLGLICALLATFPCHAGLLGRTSAVGGVSINVDGVVGPAPVDAKHRLLEERRREIKSPAGDISAPVEMRMISLKELESVCQQALRDRVDRLPDEVRFLAGIQRIQYVFVYPEENDIVLAGPGEGWKVDANANVVGITTGRPVLLLDDLLVALRSVDQARQGGITVSIDPTEAGIHRLQQLLNGQRGTNRMTPALETQMKQAFGPQQVSITGVPADSHFARVLLAADYRMKRIAMNLEPTPVAALPSYLDLIKDQSARAIKATHPRWWLACNYQPLAASPDGLAWEVRGPGVKAMTEDELVGPGGKRVVTGKSSPAAQKWADLMTEQYDALCGHDAVFGDLRNLMDMCVVSALIRKEHLAEKAGLSIPVLSESNSQLQTEVWNAPKSIAPEVSFLKGKDSFIVTASGGVALESWVVADNKEIVAEVAQIRHKAAAGSRKSLWW